MKTTENNKLIAEFMGFIECNESTYQCCFGKINRVLPPQYMEFHTDWNWLMQVVEKIESLGFIFKLTTGSSTFLKKDEVLIWNDGFIGDSKIQATYNACVEFIKWYNNGKI